MSEEIILYNGPTSPFGRKCKIAALLLDINHKEEKINIYKSQFLDEFNPLRQVPTLLINKTMISDSDNICLYFDSISIVNNTCFDEQQGAISLINLGGGVLPIEYTWSNGQITNSPGINALSSGFIV